jgi:hypothetical protein
VREAKPAKPPKEAKPKPAKATKAPQAGKDMVAPPRSVKPGPVKLADQPVIVPEHVRVQKLPGYQPRTFEPPKHFKGELCAEWAYLRGRK